MDIRYVNSLLSEVRDRLITLDPVNEAMNTDVHLMQSHPSKHNPAVVSAARSKLKALVTKVGKMKIRTSKSRYAGRR